MLHHTLRSLSRSPGFVAAAVLTLALGVGATSSIFTLINAALLVEPPYPQPERLLVLTTPAGGAQTGQLFLYVRDRVRSLTVVADSSSNGWNMVAGGLTTYVTAREVSTGYFEALGARPLLGRGFSAAETQMNGPDVVVLSERLWRQAFDGRRDVLGQAVDLGGVRHTLVGVMPAGFRTIPDAEVWTPLRTFAGDNTMNYRILGRLAEGSSVQLARAEFRAMEGDIRREFPRYPAERVAATDWVPMRDSLGLRVRTPLLVLLAAAGVVLLIACVNVAGLQVTRALGRRRELATRAALGGSRIRLAREVLFESLLLALAAAVAGAIVAAATSQLLLGLVSEDTARQMLSDRRLTIDWRVFVFTLVVALTSGLAFGVIPALSSSRVDLRGFMTHGATMTAGRAAMWTRRVVVATEIALAVVLLVGAGLLTRTLVKLVGTDPGFNAGGVLVGRMSLQGTADDGPGVASLAEEALSRIRALPGVTAVSVSNGVPVDTPFNWALDPPDGALISETRPIDWRYVTPGYFDVFQVPTLAGRAFVDTDRGGAEPVAIVNDAFALAYFGSSLDAVGRTIRLVASTQDPPRRIVGVVADSKSRSGTGWTRSLTAMGGPAAPIVFVPAGQASRTMVRSTHAAFPVTWSIRTTGASPGLERSIADAVRAVERRVSFIRFESMDAIIARDLDQPRFIASLLAAFAALAMALAAIGLYGVMSYASSQRLREVGIRMAFGATAGLVWRRFVSEGVAIAAAGLAIGVPGAVVLTRSIEAYLFGVAPLDPATYAGVAGALLLTAAVASAVPAVRAARVDPATSLRAD